MVNSGMTEQPAPAAPQNIANSTISKSTIVRVRISDYNNHNPAQVVSWSNESRQVKGAYFLPKKPTNSQDHRCDIEPAIRRDLLPKFIE